MRLDFSTNDDGCLVYDGFLRRCNGYGHVWFEGKNWLAHRLAYYLHIGNPKGIVVRHTCDNRRCVNPMHLAAGTAKDNSEDMVRRGRSARGRLQGSAKLRDSDVHTIRALHAVGMSQNEIGDIFCVARATVSTIITGRSWAWLETTCL